MLAGNYDQEEICRRVGVLMRQPERPTAFFIANNHSEIGFWDAIYD